jgi:hypothetical protein
MGSGSRLDLEGDRGRDRGCVVFLDLLIVRLVLLTYFYFIPHPSILSLMSFYDSSSSVPHSPLPIPHPRLLLPTVRIPRSNTFHVPSSPPPLAHKSPKIKSSSSRSSRTRLASPHSALDLQDSSMTIGQVWLGKSLNANFEIVHDQLELEGFQLFAVEKWSVSSLHISHIPVMNDQGHREDKAHHNFDRLYR